VTWPLVLYPFETIGHPLGEADNHLAMLWRATQAFGASDGALINFPMGIPIPIMDPVQVPLAIPTFFIHPTFGYNFVVFVNVLWAAIGCFVLARVFVSDKAALTAGAIGASSPFLAGIVEFGITESMPLGFLAVHLAGLFLYAREGRARHAWLASGALACFAFSGWYHALFAAIVNAILVPWLGLRSRRWKGLILQGLGAVLFLLPSFIQFLSVRDYWADRWHAPLNPPWSPNPFWHERAQYGTDLLNWIWPTIGALALSPATYLGLSALILAGIGCWKAKRVAAPLFTTVVVFLLLSLGHWVRIGGDLLNVGSIPISGPAGLLTQLFPVLEGVSHWHRAIGPATVCLAALAAIGTQSLLRRWVHAWWIVPLLIIVESLSLGPVQWPRHHYDPSPPIEYATLPDGPIVELPFDNAREHFSNTPARTYERWQPLHGHAISENYEGPDALLQKSRLISVADALCGLTPTVPTSHRGKRALRDPGVLDRASTLKQEVELLRNLGIGSVVLHRDRAKETDAVEALLNRALGPSTGTDSLGVWAVLPGGSKPLE